MAGLWRLCHYFVVMHKGEATGGGLYRLIAEIVSNDGVDN